MIRTTYDRALACATRQRGVALLLVLWACALLAILLGSFALATRTEAMQAHNQIAHARARYAAEAGVARAAWAISQTDPSLQWPTDGDTRTFQFAGTEVEVSIVAEDGKVDLNRAQPMLLQRLFVVLGVDQARAEHLAAAIVDWRDPDDASQPAGAEAAQYRDAGRDYAPRNGPFTSVEELQLVLGMDADLYAQVAPLLTIWSGRSQPNPAHAPLAVLEALPGMDHALAVAFLAQREKASQQGQTLLRLPNGTVALAAGNAVTHSIRSVASIDGVEASIRATIHRGGLRAGRGPYTVLQWEEGP